MVKLVLFKSIFYNRNYNIDENYSCSRKKIPHDKIQEVQTESKDKKEKSISLP
jgi:hypothetical protein